MQVIRTRPLLDSMPLLPNFEHYDTCAVKGRFEVEFRFNVKRLKRRSLLFARAIGCSNMNA